MHYFFVDQGMSLSLGTEFAFRFLVCYLHIYPFFTQLKKIESLIVLKKICKCGNLSDL